VGRRDAAAIDLELTPGGAGEGLQALLARLTRGRKRQQPAGREPPIPRRHHLERPAGVVPNARLGRGFVHPPLPPVCLPIAPGFSPASRRLMTESIPCASICSPKSVR